MARTTTIGITLLLFVGLVVALLPAQDAAQRRNASVPAEPSRLPAHLQPGSVYSAVPVAGEGEPGTMEPADDIGPLPAEQGSPLQGETNAATHSILKRPRILPTQDAAPMQSEAATAPIETSPAAQVRPRAPRRLAPVTPKEAPAPLLEQSETPAAEAPVLPHSSRRTMQPSANVRRAPAAGRVADDGSHEVQLSSRYPSLQVTLAGPPAVTVGKAAKYVLQLVNDGQTEAHDVQVRLPLPSWVSVSQAEATGGEAQVQADAMGTPRLVWVIPDVKAGANEQLHLHLVAAEGQPFDLNLEWACQAQTARARVTVRQPQLELALSGPGDMLLGDEKLFTLTVSNPGTGDAQGVVVTVASGTNRPRDVEVGHLPAGQQIEIPVQVVANQAGDLEIHASSTGDGGLKADAKAKVVVRQAQLAVTVEAPELKFAGSDASFFVTIANSGNAAADDVAVTVDLPSGAAYVGGVSGATLERGKLTWKVPSIGAGAEKQFEIHCQLHVEGTNRLAVNASGRSGIVASGEAVTEVEAISDLKLIVNDPSGPSPVGQGVAYEIQVMNRGSRSAKNVKIIMQFGEGIEPVELAGGQGKLVPGQVLCDTLPELAAGEQVTLRIKAKAEKSGAHRYRVEVTSGEEDAHLVSEGTTRFFSDGRTSAAARTAKKPAALQPTPGTIQR